MTLDEANRTKLAEAQRAHDAEADFGREANKAAINSGAESLKALLYLNGGSCVVMLAFIGTLASKDKPITPFGLPLFLFATGAGLAVLTTAAGYFTNLLITGTSTAKDRIYEPPFFRETKSSNRQRFWGEVFRYIAIFLALSGSIAFFVGLIFSYAAFRSI